MPTRLFRPLPLLLVLVLALAGCAGFQPQAGPGADPPGDYRPLTRPIIALGDTQEHESTGHPLHDNDSAVDAYVEVAQRPPEQPLFGRRILEWALHQHAEEPVLHLGDLLDLSCRSEAERMRHVFREAKNPPVWLPGNHDGLMFGIYGYRILDAALDTDARRWNRVCRRGAEDGGPHREGRQAMSKRDVIMLYLGEHVGERGDARGLTLPAPEGEQRLSWRHPDPQAFLSGIEARLLDGFRYADSFLAQRLRLPAAPGATRQVIVIGLDTNQAGALVSTWDTIMGRSPGSMGHVRPDQIEAVRPWVDEARRAGHLVVFAGHHHWNSLGLPSRLLLRSLMRDLDHPLVYLSAHTHRGFWAVHRALDRRPLLELNVSSLSDWPIAYRRLQFGYDEGAKRLRVQAELLPNNGRPLASDADLLAAWEAQACAAVGPEPEAFVRFDREQVERQKRSRGTLVEWLISALGPLCERCEQPLYEHAQAYLDAQLDTLLQLASHLGNRAHRLYEAPLPAACGDQDFFDCARRLQGETATDFAGQAALFRRKAQLVDRLNRHLDELRSPQAAAYMTCRAVQAAHIDYDLTDDARRSFRGEPHRRQEQYFRIEATVGMD